MRYVMLGFAIAVVAIVYRDVRQHNTAPAPAEFLGAAIVYSIAGVLAELVPGLGGVLAIGWTVGLLFNLIPSGAPIPAGHQAPLPGQGEGEIGPVGPQGAMSK